MNKCPTCGCEVKVEGDETKYYVPTPSPYLTKKEAEWLDKEAKELKKNLMKSIDVMIMAVLEDKQ